VAHCTRRCHASSYTAGCARLFNPNNNSTTAVGNSQEPQQQLCALKSNNKSNNSSNVHNTFNNHNSNAVEGSVVPTTPPVEAGVAHTTPNIEAGVVPNTTPPQSDLTQQHKQPPPPFALDADPCEGVLGEDGVKGDDITVPLPQSQHQLPLVQPQQQQEQPSAHGGGCSNSIIINGAVKRYSEGEHNSTATAIATPPATPPRKKLRLGGVKGVSNSGGGHAYNYNNINSNGSLINTSSTLAPHAAKSKTKLIKRK